LESLKRGWKCQVCLRFQQAKDYTTNLNSVFALKERAIGDVKKKFHQKLTHQEDEELLKKCNGQLPNPRIGHYYQ
jgi:hypothetical protein